MVTITLAAPYPRRAYLAGSPEPDPHRRRPGVSSLTDAEATYPCPYPSSETQGSYRSTTGSPHDTVFGVSALVFWCLSARVVPRHDSNRRGPGRCDLPKPCSLCPSCTRLWLWRMWGRFSYLYLYPLSAALALPPPPQAAACMPVSPKLEPIPSTGPFCAYLEEVPIPIQTLTRTPWVDLCPSEVA